jgi:hypothetical protein
MWGSLKIGFWRGYAQSWRKEVMTVQSKSIAELVQLADEARAEWAWYQARADKAAQHETEWAIKRAEALGQADKHSAQLDECVREIQRRKVE